MSNKHVWRFITECSSGKKNYDIVWESQPHIFFYDADGCHCECDDNEVDEKQVEFDNEMHLDGTYNQYQREYIVNTFEFPMTKDMRDENPGHAINISLRVYYPMVLPNMIQPKDFEVNLCHILEAIEHFNHLETCASINDISIDLAPTQKDGVFMKTTFNFKPAIGECMTATDRWEKFRKESEERRLASAKEAMMAAIFGDEVSWRLYEKSFNRDVTRTRLLNQYPELTEWFTDMERDCTKKWSLALYQNTEKGVPLKTPKTQSILDEIQKAPEPTYGTDPSKKN